MFHYENYGVTKSLGIPIQYIDIDQNVFFLFMESIFEQIFLTVSNANLASSLRAFKCQSEIVLFHFGQNKIILGLNFGFGSFRHFPAWQVWVLGDIERKAIYFNQGLPAQLLTIVG